MMLRGWLLVGPASALIMATLLSHAALAHTPAVDGATATPGPAAASVAATTATPPVTAAPAAASATATPAAGTTPAPSASGAPASGTVLLADNYSDPSKELLPATSRNPNIRLGYVNGEYEVATRAPAAGAGDVVGVPGVYGDVDVSADVRLAPGSDDQTIVQLGCRFSTAPNSFGAYIFQFKPNANQGGLFVSDSSGNFSLLPSITPDTSSLPNSLAPGAKRHLELSCAGNTIGASIDGVQVALAQDGTYQSGLTFIGVALPGSVTGSLDAFFSNLTLTQP